MKYFFKLVAGVIIFINQTLIAQNTLNILNSKDTSYFVKVPTTVKVSTLFSNKSIGLQLGFSRYILQKEKHKFRKNGNEKIIKKDKILSFDFGYYYQPGLHQNFFTTSSFSIKRTGKRGFYSDFAPFLGISRTFLANTTYIVNENGDVLVKKFAGTWDILSGFSYGIGKKFNSNYFLNDVYFKIYTQLLYPNFKFINIKPLFQLGTSFNLEKIQKTSKRILKYKHR